MNADAIQILGIVTQICENFKIEGEGKEKAMGYFNQYLPIQDPKDLRNMLIKINKDLKSWDGVSDSSKVIHKLYSNIAENLKGTPLSGRGGAVMRGIAWRLAFKKQLKRSELRPMINVTVGQIKRQLEGYLGEK